MKPVEGESVTEREKMMNDLILSLPNPLTDVRLDAFTFYFGMEYLKKEKPRVVYFAFDETDDFAHGGEYAAYLNSAHYTDRFVSELWTYLQTDPVYKDKTTLILTADHGRGNNAEEWRHHGAKIVGADQIWLAVLGPDSKTMGEVNGDYQLYQNQIAKTIAALLGSEFGKEQKEGPVIPSVITR